MKKPQRNKFSSDLPENVPMESSDDELGTVVEIRHKKSVEITKLLDDVTFFVAGIKKVILNFRMTDDYQLHKIHFIDEDIADIFQAKLKKFKYSNHYFGYNDLYIKPRDPVINTIKKILN